MAVLSYIQGYKLKPLGSIRKKCKIYNLIDLIATIPGLIILHN